MAFDTSGYKEKAKIAVERRNYADAIGIYMDILGMEPKDLDARRSLRAVEIRAAKEAGTSRTVAILKHLFTFLKLMIPSKNHEQVMLDCEKVLVDDPTNPTVLKRLAAACLTGGYADTAVMVLEDLKQQNAKDVATLRMLQAAYQAKGDIPKALEVNRAILAAAPDDREASQTMRDLSAADMAGKFQKAAAGGEDGKVARKGLIRDEREAQKLGRVLRTEDEVGEEIADVKRDIEKRPDDPRLYVKLGNLYMRLKQYTEARAQYDMAHEISPTEYSIVMKQQDVKIMQMEDNFNAAKKARSARPSDAAATAAFNQAYQELMKYKLACFVERERQFPTDLNIAFDLANIYFAAKKYDEAIMRYQKTVNDPKNRPQSLLNLGIAFHEKGQYDLAIHRFSEGESGVEIWNDMKKTLLYHRGNCYQAMGDNDRALADFTAIYEKDISFRDTAKRVEALRRAV